jgi:hypothetical protein
MNRKSRQRAPLLSGASGFILSEAARLLGAEWGAEPQDVARALWRDFAAGVFDPPVEEAKSHGASTLSDPNAPEAAEPVTYCWELLSVDWSLQGDDKVTNERITSESTYAAFASGYIIGWEVNLSDRVVIPRDAIVRFCTRRQREIPPFLLPQAETTETILTEQEVYETLREIGLKVEYHIKDLAAEVSKRLGRQVKPTMRAFIKALGRARATHSVRIARVGRPTNT